MKIIYTHSYYYEKYESSARTYFFIVDSVKLLIRQSQKTEKLLAYFAMFSIRELVKWLVDLCAPR